MAIWEAAGLGVVCAERSAHLLLEPGDDDDDGDDDDGDEDGDDDEKEEII